MRIVNGKKFYKKDIDACVSLHFDGWDYYNGQNYQYYAVRYNPECGLVVLEGSNSGDFYGDYEKIQLVVGEGFVKQVNDKVIFAGGKAYEDAPEKMITIENEPNMKDALEKLLNK